MKFTRILTGLLILSGGTIYANQETGPAATKALAKYCKKPQISALLSENDLNKLNSANEVLASAKLCSSKNQNGECVIEDIVEDSVFTRMKLREKDAFITSNVANISDSMGIVSAFQGLVNHSVDCLVVRRHGKPIAIRYTNRPQSKR